MYSCSKIRGNDMKRHRSYKSNKSILIGVLLAVVFLMGIGYSAFSDKLNISGTSNISTKWKVVITNIKLEKLTGMATEESDVTFSELNASMNVNFKSPGDSAKYAITWRFNN